MEECQKLFFQVSNVSKEKLQHLKLYDRYVDDIIRSISHNRTETKLDEMNNFHPSLNFTIERETEGALPFLDMKVMRSNCKLSSTWYCKPTDTGLIMNFHALAPSKHKRSVVCGFVHRIFRSCSSWMHFHTSLTRVKNILVNNQYTASFYEPLISAKIEKLLVVIKPNDLETDQDEEKAHMLFLQYRGKVTDDYVRALRHLKATISK